MISWSFSLAANILTITTSGSILPRVKDFYRFWKYKQNNKHNTICVWHDYAQKNNTNNVNKIWDSYKQLKVKTNRTSFLCRNRNGHHNTELRSLISCPSAGNVSVLFVLYFVYQMLPVSLDCPFVIVPSVFSNVYLIRRYWRRRSKQQFDRFPAGKSYDFMVFLTRGEYTNYNYIRVYSTTCKRLL
jgi:hypothetical protein